MSRIHSIRTIREKWMIVSPHLDEKAIRFWAASEALSLGKFGIADVAKAIGISRTTIYHGIEEIEKGTDLSRVRKKGCGRKKIAQESSKISHDLEDVLKATTLGDPESAAQ